MPTRWHMMTEKQLSILIQGRNYARENRQIIRIPRAFACISAGAPWLWRSIMQIDKVSQEPARLRMLTAPFHGTFFPLEVHSANRACLMRRGHSIDPCGITNGHLDHKSGDTSALRSPYTTGHVRVPNQYKDTVLLVKVYISLSEERPLPIAISSMFWKTFLLFWNEAPRASVVGFWLGFCFKEH